jgi:hypothetical protein
VLFLAVIIGFMISIRNIGIIFPIAILINIIFKSFSGRISKSEWARHFAVCILSLTFYALIAKIIFPSSADGLFSYKYLIDTGQLKHFFMTNLHYYMAVLRAFFEPWNDQWQFIALLSGTMIFAFIILGLLKKLNSGFGFFEILTLTYLASIIIYPYSNAGFRFLLPLVPLMLYFLVQGISTVNIPLKLKPASLAVVLAIIVLLSYQKGISEILKSQKVIADGPQEKDNQEMFEYIRMNTDKDALFSFIRPRAFALYAKRKAITHRQHQSTEEINSSLETNNIDYLIINNKEKDDSVLMYVSKYKNKVELIWENNQNKLYRLR